MLFDHGPTKVTDCTTGSKVYSKLKLETVALTTNKYTFAFAPLTYEGGLFGVPDQETEPALVIVTTKELALGV